MLQGDSSEGHKSDSEVSDGPTPRKRPKQRKAAVGEEDSSDGKLASTEVFHSVWYNVKFPNKYNHVLKLFNYMFKFPS